MSQNSLQMPAPDVLVVGELLWDRLPERDVLGGAPANVAFRLHELGRPVALLSRVGNDAFGQRAIDQLQKTGMDVSSIQVDAQYPTGTVSVKIDSSGDAHYTIHDNVAYDHLALSDNLLAQARAARVLCFGTLIQRHEASRQAVQALVSAASRAKVLVDINLRPKCYTQEIVLEALSGAHMAKLNESEAQLVGKWLGFDTSSMSTLCQQLGERFALEVCLITRGEKGGVAWSPTTSVITWDAPKVQVVDTVGAGDAFTAAFIHTFLSSQDLAQACKAGAELGAQVAATQGAMSPLPALKNKIGDK